MFLELSRSALRANFWRLFNDLSKSDELIDSVADDSEATINKAIQSHLNGYSLNLGSIHFKNQQFGCSVETETYRSHGRICQMVLPSQELGTEMGDLIIAVDHVLYDLTKPGQAPKIIGGACSFIQTKKEDLAKKGISARQLYLMTQWPRFHYNKKYWEFRLFPDDSSFYLFVPGSSSKQQPKSSLLSSVMLTRFMGVNKTSLLNNISGTIPLSNVNIIEREPTYDSKMPFTFAAFLIRSLHLSIGSQSINARMFLRDSFFPLMEEVEDCPSTTSLVNTPQSDNYDKRFHKKNQFAMNNEDSILAVRFKVIIKRVE